MSPTEQIRRLRAGLLAVCACSPENDLSEIRRTYRAVEKAGNSFGITRVFTDAKVGLQALIDTHPETLVGDPIREALVLVMDLPDNVEAYRMQKARLQAELPSGNEEVTRATRNLLSALDVLIDTHPGK